MFPLIPLLRIEATNSRINKQTGVTKFPLIPLLRIEATPPILNPDTIGCPDGVCEAQKNRWLKQDFTP